MLFHAVLSYGPEQYLHTLTGGGWCRAVDHIAGRRRPLRHSMTVYPLLLLLHRLQQGARLPSKWLPPRTNGTTWSMVVA